MKEPNNKSEVIPNDVYREWHKENYKPFSQDEIFKAIAQAANKEGEDLTNDFKGASVQDVRAAWTAGKKGAPLGRKRPYNCTLRVTGPFKAQKEVINQSNNEVVYNEDGSKYTVPIEIYSATMAAWNYDPIKREGSPQVKKLSFGKLLSSSSSVSIPSVKTDEEIKKEAQDLYIGELSKRAVNIRSMLSLVAQDIWAIEAEEIKENQHLMEMEKADAFYPNKKHASASREFLNKVYANALIVPDEYNPFNINDNYRIKTELNKIDIQKNPIEWHEKNFEITRDTLESGIAQLKYMDYTGENKLVATYEEKFGPVRDINEREEARINSTVRKRFSEEELERRAAEGEEVTRNVANVSGKKMILPAIQVSDLGNPDAIPQGMQLFTNSDKRTGAGLSTSNCVYPVAGDFTQEPDIIVYGEGGATLASLAQKGEHIEEYKDKNVWYVAAFDADNLVKVGKEMITRFPDATHVVHGDNDTHVYAVRDLPENKGDEKKRKDRTPILDENGQYQYIANDGVTLLKKEELNTNRGAQFHQLKENKGAYAVRELTQFFSENALQREDGSFIKPKIAAYVSNNDLNKTVTDYLWEPKKLIGDLPRPNKVPADQIKLDFALGKTHGDANDWLEGMVEAESVGPLVSFMYAGNTSRIPQAVRDDINEKIVAKAANLFMREPQAIAEKKFSDYFDKQLSRGAIKPINPSDIPTYSKGIDTQATLAQLEIAMPERGYTLTENAQKIKEDNERAIKEAEQAQQQLEESKKSSYKGSYTQQAGQSKVADFKEPDTMPDTSDFGFGNTYKQREEYQATQAERDADAKIDELLAQFTDMEENIPIIDKTLKEDAQLSQQQQMNEQHEQSNNNTASFRM